MNDISRKNQEGKCAGMIILDMPLAFDLLVKYILQSKLKSIGVNQNKIAWISSYLSNNTQRVRTNDTLSEKRAIKIDCPQGPRFSPLLFNVS